MSDVETTIDIAASPAAVWAIALDPHRLQDWVTIHRELKSADDGPPRQGMQMDQVMELSGRRFDVSWTLATMEEERLAEWEGKGPLRSKAKTRYRLEALEGGGTRFHYFNSFSAPGGPLGKIAGNALVGDGPRAEAEKSLHKLKGLLEGS